MREHDSLEASSSRLDASTAKGDILAPSWSNGFESAHLVVLIERTKVILFNKSSNSCITEPDPVVEIAKPDDRVMVFNGSVVLKT